MKLAHRLALVAAAFAAAPALAQDTPPGPGADKGPAPPAAPDAPKDGAVPPKAAEPANKERKVDPKATEAFEKYRALLHSPASLGIKSLAGKGELEAPPMLMEPVTFSTSWSQEKSLGLGDVALPESILAQIPAEMLDQLKSMVMGQIMMVVRPVFGAVGEGMEEYDIAYKAGDGDAVISMTPISDKVAYDSVRYTIGGDGLVKLMTFSLHVPPENPMAAQYAGVEFETKFTYVKKGERNVVTEMTVSDPMTGDTVSKIAYYEVQGGYLPKGLQITSMQGEQTIRFFDYKADGKAVEGTAKAAEKKAEEPKKEPTPAAPTGPEAPKDGSTPAGPGK